MLQSTVVALHSFKYCLAANLVDRETESFFVVQLWKQNRKFEVWCGSVLLFRRITSRYASLILLSTVLHAILIMVQATTLNVAFNSHNKSLLTIMMSNNVSMQLYYIATLNFLASFIFVYHMSICILSHLFISLFYQQKLTNFLKLAVR